MKKEEKEKLNSEMEVNAERKEEITSESAENETLTEKSEDAAENSEKKKKHKKEKKDDIIEELAEKLADISDKHLRLQAEFDNFRRRTIKEKADLIKSGGESVLLNILPVVDDFERALNSLKEVPDDDPGKQGTLLIYAKFKEFLKQNNVIEIDALHSSFDVDHHEALTKIPAPEEKLKGKVVDVIQKGYQLNDKVIRFAKVVVGE
ncbi:MAG: nucleotide exchange factor GrpE [Draconibacterium sp.]|jgi:molecular chaperone GrpE